jgi:hypothetical protein
MEYILQSNSLIRQSTVMDHIRVFLLQIVRYVWECILAGTYAIARSLFWVWSHRWGSRVSSVSIRLAVSRQDAAEGDSAEFLWVFKP